MDDVSKFKVLNLQFKVDKCFYIYLVVKSAFVLVAVSVYGTEETSTPTGEPSQTDLLLTNKTAVLLLLPLLVPIVGVLAA